MLSNLHLPLEEAVITAARLGAEGVQLWTAGGELDPDEASESLRRDLTRLLDREGLEISALCADYGRPFTSEENVQWLIPRMQEQIDLALAFRTQIITTHIGVVPSDRESPEWKTLYSAMRELGEYGERMEVAIAAETGPEDPALLREFLDAVGSPAIRVNYDPANLAMKGFDPVKGVADLAPYIVHTHAKDGVRHSDGRAEEVPLGEGDVDWDAYVNALRDIAFDGFLTVERESSDDPVGDISHAISFLRLKVGG